MLERLLCQFIIPGFGNTGWNVGNCCNCPLSFSFWCTSHHHQQMTKNI